MFRSRWPSVWVYLAVYWLLVVLFAVGIVATHGPDELMALLMIPILWGALQYPRWALWLMAGVLYIASLVVIFFVSGHFFSSMRTLSALSVVVILLMELIYLYSRRRVQTESALRALEELYSQAMAAADAVPYRRDYASNRFTFMGKEIERLTGYSAEEMTPQLLDQITQESYMRGALEGVAEEEAIRRVMAGDVLQWANDFRIITRDGQSRWLSDVSFEILGPDGRPVSSVGMLQDITYRKEIEERLRVAKEYAERLIDTANVLFVGLDEYGRVTSVNRTTEAVTGYSRDELIGRDWFATIIPEEARDEVVAAFRRVLAADTVQPGNFDSPLITRKGERKRILWSHSRTMTPDRRVEVLSFGIDGTDLYEAQETLRKLWHAVEHSPSAIVITDVNANIEYVNPRFVELTGYTREEVIGKNPRIFKSGKTPPEVYVELWDTITSGKVWKGEFCNRKKNGQLYWEAASIGPVFDERGEITHYIAVKEDITERRETEATLRALVQELDAYAHTVAHDLKTPLSVVIGYADALLEMGDELPAEERRRSLEAIIRNGYRMQSIIDNLLLLARVRRETEIPVQPLKMDAIVADVLDRLAGMIAERQAQIEVPSSWPVALGYAPWVEEVWVNYISNAIKYGGDPPRIELGADKASDGMIRFWVRDNGRGIPPERRSTLFEPFSRLGGERVGSHGLGLSIVQRIVTRLGGEVGVESTGVPGQGSLFYFTLPAASK